MGKSTAAGAFAAGQAAKDNAYVQRLIEDAELRENLRSAYESARKAYARIADGKSPVKALESKKTQKDLRDAAESLRDAAEALRGGKRKRGKRRGRVFLLAIVGGGLALALSEGLRKKVLDALFGAEEEFEYTASTTPASSGTPVGTS